MQGYSLFFVDIFICTIFISVAIGVDFYERGAFCGGGHCFQVAVWIKNKADNAMVPEQSPAMIFYDMDRARRTERPHRAWADIKLNPNNTKGV